MYRMFWAQFLHCILNRYFNQTSVRYAKSLIMPLIPAQDAKYVTRLTEFITGLAETKRLLLLSRERWKKQIVGFRTAFQIHHLNLTICIVRVWTCACSFWKKTISGVNIKIPKLMYVPTNTYRTVGEMSDCTYSFT